MKARQSTTKTFLLGPILDADGVAKTDEVVGSIKVAKNGVVGAANASSTLTHDHTGHYLFVADAGDFDTLGEVTFSLDSTTNAMQPKTFEVVPEGVYDSLVSGTDILQADLTQILGTAFDETVAGYIAAAFKKLFDVETPVMTAASVNQTTDNPTAAAIVTALLTDLLSSADFNTASSFGKLIKDNIDAKISSRHASGAAVAKSPATLAAGDVSGNLPADVQTAKGRAVGDVGSGNTAHLLQAADTGATAVARTGADSDTLKTLSDEIDLLGTGTGARTVTVTVTDGTDPLENARVRMTAGADSLLGLTNASGVVTFYLDDATWDVVITKRPGYTFDATTLVVDDDKTATYAMAQETFPESDPGAVTGYLYCYDEEDAAEKDVVVLLQRTGYASSTGEAYDTAYRTETSDATGLVSFINLMPGATYKWSRGPATLTSRPWVSVTIAADATSPVALTSGGGRDE
jgi:hypothetical protein